MHYKFTEFSVNDFPLNKRKYKWNDANGNDTFPNVRGMRYSLF